MAPSVLALRGSVLSPPEPQPGGRVEPPTHLALVGPAHGPTRTRDASERLEPTQTYRRVDAGRGQVTAAGPPNWRQPRRAPACVVLVTAEIRAGATVVVLDDR